MSRIFLSHSSRDNRQAIALRQWLIAQDAGLADEIFLDLDPSAGILSGTRWKEALRQASTRCEAVICLLSENWLSSPECRTEYRFAEYLNKRIFSARVGVLTGEDPTAEWQHIDLVEDGAPTQVDIGDGGEPITFSTDGLRRLHDGIASAGIGAESFAWPPPREPDRAPYRGWEPLEEVDAAIFFGRDAQIVRGLDALRGMRRSGIETLFVVLGPSGTGKSSFLRAGLLPRLRRDDRDFALLDIVRPQRSVLTGDAGLAKAVHTTRNRLGLTGPDLGTIKRACASGDAGNVREWLLEVRHAAAARLLTTSAEQSPPTLVLPVDQAEELFGSDAGREAPQFLELIAELSQAAAGDETTGMDLIVAVTIRSDLYEPLQTAPQLADVGSVLFDDLKPMPGTQFKEVITGPAARATEGGRPLSVDPALVNHLLDDCTEGADTLPLLALTLARLYEDYGDDGALTLRDYRSMGGVRSVVQSEIDQLLASDDERRATQLQQLRRAFIPWLATVGSDSNQPVRRAARWADLPAESLPLLARLVARRLLVTDTRDGEVVVEVALESLLRQWDDLATWLAEERGDLRDADHLERSASAWEENGRNAAWLLEGTRLVEAESLCAKPGFRDRLAHIHEFIAASRRREQGRAEAEEKRRAAELQAARALAAAETGAREKAQAHAAVLRKRTLVLRAVLAVALVIAAAAVYGFVTAKKDSDRANERTREALGLRLTYQGQTMLAGIQGGGDIRALTQILAAQHVAADNIGGLFTAALMRIDTAKIIQSNAAIMDVTYTTDGQRLVSGGADHTVRVWDAHTGQPIGPPMMQTNSVTDAALSDDGKDVAFASADSVRVWNALTGQPVDPPMLQNSAVTSLDLSYNGQLVAAGSPDGTTRVWNAATAAPLTPPMVGQISPVTTVDFSDDGQRVAVGDANGTLRVWNTVSGQPITPPMTGHTGAVVSAAFSPDGQRLVSGGVDHTVRLWNAEAGQPIGAPMTGHQNTVTSVVFNPDGSRIASGSFDGTLRIWDAATQHPIAQPMTGHVGSINAVAFSPDGHRLLTGGADETLRVWDADVGPPSIGASGGANSGVTSVTVSTDRHRIVSGDSDGSLRLWDADNRTLIGELTNGRHAAATSVAISPDGRSIVSGAADGTLQRWNAETKSAVGPVIEAHKGSVTSLVFSWDGSHVGSGGADATARVWDVATGQPVGAAMTGHTAPVLAVAFSPNGQLLVTGGADTTLRLWNAETGKPMGDPMTGHTAAVTDVAFGPGGGRIVSRSDDHTLRLWDATTGAPVGPPMNAHNAYMLGVEFSPDGRQLLSTGPAQDRRLFPPPALTAWSNLLCAKLSANPSQQQWHDWIAPDIGYTELCPGLPIAPDNGTG